MTQFDTPEYLAKDDLANIEIYKEKSDPLVIDAEFIEK